MQLDGLLTDLLARIDGLVAGRGPTDRVLIGIVGAPGAGKSTLAELLVDAVLERDSSWAVAGPPLTEPQLDPRRRWIGSHVAHVPMDGFHLADVELQRLGRSSRKGAPDTFDALGYAALLRRIRAADEDVWAPGFDRDIDQPIAGTLPVLRAARVIVTEGNYLLVDDPTWGPIRALLDETWYVDLDEQERLRRLVARHEQFGKSPDQALAWATGPDQRNADVIRATRERADLLVVDDTLDGTSAPRQTER